MLNNRVFEFSKWICPNEFSSLVPIDVFHREKEIKEIELPEDLKNLHIYMKKTIQVNQVKRTILRITADDYYRLKINGKFVGQGPAQGYYFNYYWNEYDITDCLFEGTNEIFADVYYNGLISLYHNEQTLFEQFKAKK